jgi:hypothetical protein
MISHYNQFYHVATTATALLKRNNPDNPLAGDHEAGKNLVKEMEQENADTAAANAGISFFLAW